MSDHSVPGEVDTLCGSRVTALPAGTVCVSFTFIYCNDSSEQDPGSKVQFKEWVPVVQLPEA